MGADKQALDAIFKEVFEDGISEGVTNKNAIRDLIKTEKVPFRGKEIQSLLHTSRNTSPMFVGEDSAFADAGQQGYTRLTVDQKKLMARLRLTWEVMQDSTSSEGSFISARKSEMQYIIDDIARRDEYALASTGRGILCLVDESPSGTTLDVDAPGGVTNDNFGNRFVSVGMFIAAINPNTGGLRSSIRKVVETPSAGATLVFDASTYTGWANNDYLVQAANSSVDDVLNTSYERAWEGLMSLVDDNTYNAEYFGVTRADIPALTSYVTASTGALSTDLIQRVSDVVDQKLDGKVSIILCHHSIRRLVVQLTDSDRRYMGASLSRPDPGTVAFKQGDIPFGDVPVRALRDFPLDVMMFLDVEGMEFKEYVSESGKWVDEDGSVLVRVGSGSTGRDAFEAWYRMRKQYFVGNPGKCARLDGITNTGLIVQRAAGS